MPARKRRNHFSLRPITGEPTALQPANVMPSGYILEYHSGDSEATSDSDAEFGGTEARRELERRLLLKLDTRMSILVVIYILSYVSCTLRMGFPHVLRC